MIRPYIDAKIHDRVLKYADNIGVKLHTRSGVTQVYEQLINSILDESGNPRTGLVLTETQMNAIAQISKDMDQSPAKTTQDLINFALLVFGSNIPLNLALLTAVPLMMDELVQVKPEIAKEILKGLKNEGEKRGGLNQQAALRYSESTTLDVEGD